MELWQQEGHPTRSSADADGTHDAPHIQKITLERLELSKRLGLDDIISVLQQTRLRWYAHVLRKEDNDWVKKCMKWRVPDQEVDQRRLREVVQRLSST